MTVYYNDNDPFCCAWVRELIKAKLIPDGEVDGRSIVDVQPDDLRGFRQVHFFCGIAGWAYALRLARWDDSMPVWTGSAPCQPFSVAGKRKGAIPKECPKCGSKSIRRWSSPGPGWWTCNDELCGHLWQTDVRDLWPLWFNLIRQRRPECVFGEQVTGAIRLRWLDGVFADLEGEGYTCGAAVLGAHSIGEKATTISDDATCLTCGRQWDDCECVLPGPFSDAETITIGAPHIRQRVYWVAYAPMSRRCERKLHNENGTERTTAREGLYEGLRFAEIASGSTTDGLADPERPNPRLRIAGEQEEQTDISSSPWSDSLLVPCRDGESRRVGTGVPVLAHGIPRDLRPLRATLEGMGYSPREARRMLRRPRSLLALAGRSRVTRLRAYGNSIVPQLAAEFVKAFMAVR